MSWKQNIKLLTILPCLRKVACGESLLFMKFNSFESVSYIYICRHVSQRDRRYIFYLFLTGHALNRRVRSPAYVHYMRMLFLIAMSRIDYDTRLMIYIALAARAHTRHTHIHTQGLALNRIAQHSAASTEAIPDSFLNYRSFRSRGRLGASMFLSRDSVRDFCMRRGRTSRQSWWDKDRNPFGLEIYMYAFLYRKLFDSLNWDRRKNVPTRLLKRSRANFSALGLLLFSYRFLTNAVVRDNYPLIPNRSGNDTSSNAPRTYNFVVRDLNDVKRGASVS